MPDPPANVHLSVASSTSVQVTFWEPLSVNSAVVTKYKGKGLRAPSIEYVGPGIEGKLLPGVGRRPGLEQRVPVKARDIGLQFLAQPMTVTPAESFPFSRLVFPFVKWW